MPKFGSRPSNVRAPIATASRTPDARTFEGGAGFSRDARSELFLLAASNFVSESTFYEDADARDDRFERLIHQVTAEDPGWVARFVPYLRDTMHMRSASIVVAAEYVRAGGPHGRRVVDAALQRPDEPGEMLAYWRSRHGRSLPQPIKRGVADAVRRLYTERAAIKWDGTGRAWRFADVIETVHVRPAAPWQSQLFKWLLDERHHGDGWEGNKGDDGAAVTLPVLAADLYLRRTHESNRRAALGSAVWDQAGWNWERLAGWLPGGMDASAWEAMIPSMGYMALLRNLRNFEDAGISEDVAQQVIVRLTDPAEVARSKQFPYRFYTAFKAIPGLRYAYALERALALSLANVPALNGETLIMVDTSGSMVSEQFLREFHPKWREKNKNTMPWELAAIFGIALGMRAEHADVYTYGTGAQMVEIPRGASLLRLIEQIPHASTYGQATLTMQVARDLVEMNARRGRRYKRIVILTDEQAFAAGPADLAALDGIDRIYTFNMAGYSKGHMPSGERGRYTFGGLSDAAFDLLPALEGTTDGRWPF